MVNIEKEACPEKKDFLRREHNAYSVNSLTSSSEYLFMGHVCRARSLECISIYCGGRIEGWAKEANPNKKKTFLLALEDMWSTERNFTCINSFVSTNLAS